MKKTMRALALSLSLMTAAAALTACTVGESSGMSAVSNNDAEQSTGDAQQNDDATVNLSVPALDVSAYTDIELSNADTNTAWDDSAVILECTGDAVNASSAEGVSVDGQCITITEGGTYVLQGKLSDGTVVIALNDNTEKVHLVLNGISISSASTAAIWVQQADKVIVTLAEGTENMLSDGTDYATEDDTDTTPNACLYSKDDLTINGSGSLTVNGNCNNGIQTSDDLRIVGGSITVNAVNHGVRGSDSVVIKEGVLTISAQGDGIKSTTTDTEGKGFVDIEGGTVTVSAEQDAVDAAIALVVSGGTMTLQSGGGIANAPVHSGGMGGVHGGWGDWFTDTNSSDTTVSTKGMKAGSVMAILGGTVTVDSADDALHCNNDILLSGGTLSLGAGDDGIHADNELTIEGNAVLNVTQAYEGLEAYHINICGGETRVTASDDGLNAAGGDTASSAVQDGGFNGGFGGFGGFAAGSGELNISGGYLYVNAAGDGLDSNGNITMTGGCAVVCGPTNSGNGPLDSGDNNNTITLTGGTLIAVGATGMMEVPESNYIASGSLNAAAGTLIAVTDTNGEVLGVLQTPKTAQGIVFSCNGASDGYIVYSGGSYDGTLNADGWATGGSYKPGTEICSGSGSIDVGGMGGGFGGGGFGGGGRPGGRW